jgi:ABC-type transport system involved in multi-copper enzyme maturation permease subunit
MRMKIAGAATLAFAACFVASELAPSVLFGKILFSGLSWLCMIYGLAAGRLMTADCLSREKREGTLGLLFLTDLKGYDVVLGKLAATSLDGFYGLLAVFPLLAIPLLAGGMTNGELWRMALVLVNTFLFSLAIGLFVSAMCRDEQKAMAANFGLLLLLAAVPPAFGAIHMMSTVRPLPMIHGFFYSCPVYSFWQSADGAPRVAGQAHVAALASTKRSTTPALVARGQVGKSRCLPPTAAQRERLFLARGATVSQSLLRLDLRGKHGAMVDIHHPDDRLHRRSGQFRNGVASQRHAQNVDHIGGRASVGRG